MPHYNEDDAYRLLRDVPVMNLLRPSAGLYLLRRHVQNLEAWRDFVPLYGSVRCAPLDFLYTYLQCVAALDDLLLLDLLHAYHPHWRCVLIGSWIAALAPRAQYHDELVKARPFAHHPERTNAQWAVDLALAAITGKPPPELAEHHDLLAQIRAVLASLPKPVVRLRRIPARGEEDAAERMLIEERYRREGVEAARATIAGSRWRCVWPGSSEWKNACVLDSGDGRHRGPSREIWYWDYNLQI